MLQGRYASNLASPLLSLEFTLTYYDVFGDTYTSSGTYVEADRARVDDYYLAEGTGLASRLVANPVSVLELAPMDGPAYERWVAGRTVETDQPKGRLRDPVRPPRQGHPQALDDRDHGRMVEVGNHRLLRPGPVIGFVDA